MGRLLGATRCVQPKRLGRDFLRLLRPLSAHVGVKQLEEGAQLETLFSISGRERHQPGGRLKLAKVPKLGILVFLAALRASGLQAQKSSKCPSWAFWRVSAAASPVARLLRNSQSAQVGHSGGFQLPPG